MLWDTKTVIKFSILFFLIVGVLIWRLGSETEKKFPAYHAIKSNSKKDSKIAKVTRYIKERLTTLDQWRPIESTKPRTKASTKPLIDITYPKEGYKTSQGEVVIISWNAENTLAGQSFRFNYKDSKGWSTTKFLNALESSYYWKVPDGISGSIDLHLGIYDSSKSKWVVYDLVNIMVEEKKVTAGIDKKRPPIKTAKVDCRVHNVGSLSVFAPKNGASFSNDDTILISWEESSLPVCPYRKTYIHYKINKPGLGLYFIKDVPSLESINKYYWSIPEELRGQNILVSVAVSCHTGTWDVGPVCRSLFIE